MDDIVVYKIWDILLERLSAMISTDYSYRIINYR